MSVFGASPTAIHLASLRAQQRQNRIPWPDSAIVRGIGEFRDHASQSPFFDPARQHELQALARQNALRPIGPRVATGVAATAAVNRLPDIVRGPAQALLGAATRSPARQPSPINHAIQAREALLGDTDPLEALSMIRQLQTQLPSDPARGSVEARLAQAISEIERGNAEEGILQIEVLLNRELPSTRQRRRQRR